MREKRSTEEQHAIEEARLRRKVEKRTRAAQMTRVKANLTPEQAECAALLISRAAELGQRPNRTDMAAGQASRIRRAFGPWPRALEAAGLKPPRPPKPNRDKLRRDKRRMKEQDGAPD